MKKRLFYLLLTLLFVAIGGYFWLASGKSNFSLASDADFYLVTSRKVYGIKAHQDGLSIVKTSQTDIAPDSFSFFPVALFGEKVVFSKGWLGPGFSEKEHAIVSMDFMDGRITTNQTEQYAYTGAGYSQNYFYTCQTTTENTTITQFNVDGTERKRRTFDAVLIPGGGFSSDQDGVLSLVVSEDFTDYMLTIKEEDLSIIAKQELHREENKHYRYGSSLVLKDKLYTPLHSIRDMDSKEVIAENRLLVQDLVTNKDEFLTLPMSSALGISSSKQLLCLTHDASMTGQIGMTLFDIKTGEMTYVDVTSLLQNKVQLDTNTANLSNVTVLADGRLVFTVQQTLVYYDWKNHQLLDLVELEKEDPIYIKLK